MKNKGFIVIFVIYLLLFVADFTTTFLVGPAKEALETNPLFILTKSFTPVIVLNFLYITFFYWAYNKKSSKPFSRFNIILIMCVIIFLRLIAIRNASFWIDNPISQIEAEKIVTQQMKNESIIWLQAIALAPVILAVTSFFFFSKDHIITRKDD